MNVCKLSRNLVVILHLSEVLPNQYEPVPKERSIGDDKNDSESESSLDQRRI